MGVANVGDSTPHGTKLNTVASVVRTSRCVTLFLAAPICNFVRKANFTIIFNAEDVTFHAVVPIVLTCFKVAFRVAHPITQVLHFAAKGTLVCTVFFIIVASFIEALLLANPVSQHQGCATWRTVFFRNK